MNAPSLKLLLLTGLVLACRCSAPAQTNEEIVMIFGHERTGEGKIEYFVPRARILAQANEWAPGTEPLPVNLRDCSEKARRHLEMAKRPKHPLRVREMTIQIAGRLWSKGSDEQVSPARKATWFLVFEFGYYDKDGVLASPNDYRVVMLLDGTFADERVGVSGL